MEEEKKEKSLIKQLEENLNQKGYICISQVYINGSNHYHFINKENFDYIGVSDEDLDEEELWNMLGTTEEEVKTKVMERKTNNGIITSKEKLMQEVEKAICNYDDEDYEAVIKDFVIANQEVIKDETERRLDEEVSERTERLGEYKEIEKEIEDKTLQITTLKEEIIELEDKLN